MKQLQVRNLTGKKNSKKKQVNSKEKLTNCLEKLKYRLKRAWKDVSEKAGEWKEVAEEEGLEELKEEGAENIWNKIVDRFNKVKTGKSHRPEIT